MTSRRGCIGMVVALALWLCPQNDAAFNCKECQLQPWGWLQGCEICISVTMAPAGCACDTWYFGSGCPQCLRYGTTCDASCDNVHQSCISPHPRIDVAKELAVWRARTKPAAIHAG
jgi:hypothetical protein